MNSRRHPFTARRLLLIGTPIFLGLLMLGFLIIGVGVIVINPGFILGLPHTDFRVCHTVEESLKGLSPEDSRFSKAVADIHLPPGAKGWLVLRNGETQPIGETTEPLTVEIPESAWRGVGSHLLLGKPAPLFASPQPAIQFGPVYDKQNLQFAVTVLNGTQPPPPPTIVKLWLPLIVLFLSGLLGALVLTLLVMGRFDKPLLAFRRNLQLYGTVSLEAGLQAPVELQDLTAAMDEMKVRMDQAQTSLRLANRDAVQAERVREEFLAEVSHSLGTPLGVVQGWLGLLSEGTIEERSEQQEVVEKVVAELRRIDTMVERMERLAEWEQMEPETDLAEFPLEEPLQEVLQILSLKFQESRIAVVCDDLSEFNVLADRSWTREIFQVLLENVCRHSAAGRVEIKAARRQNRIAVTVKDDGKGIRPDLLVRLSERYLSGAAGSGLGIAMADKLVRNHGGKLVIKSKPGEGSTFRFTLPVG